MEHDKDIRVILKLSKNYEEEEIIISKIPSTTYSFYWFSMKKISLTFKYQVTPGARKLSKEVKSTLQKYPLIPVRFYTKTKRTPIIEALVDSGADTVHIHKAIAEDLNLPIGKKIESSGMGGKYMTIESEVGLIIGRAGREVDFGYVKTVFPEKELNVPVLIGRNPVFEEYQVIFEEYRNRFKLIPKEEVSQ